MTRSVDEWIGKTDDAPLPPRVKLRVFERAFGRCQGLCGGRKIMTGEQWECDHVIAIVNGGQNRETNLQVLCGWCHTDKTRNDVREKSSVRRKRSKHLGIHKSKTPIRGWRRFNGEPVRNPKTV